MSTESDPSLATRKKEIIKNFAIGFGTSFVLNAIIITYWIKINGGPYSAEVGFTGLLLQPIYFIVAVVCGLLKHRPGLASGLVCGAGLTLMSLPAMCFGLLFLSAHN